MRTHVNQLLPLILFYVFIKLVGCGADRSIVAEVGTQAITSHDFITRYNAARQKLGLPDNGQVREGVLQEMVDEELLIQEADRRGFRKDSEGELELERIRTQKLLDLYQKTRVWSRLQIEDRDLEEYFIRFNTRLKARHLYAPSRREADSLHSLLGAGYTFEQLARKIFKDARLRDSGGSLGYFTVDEMDANFENAAFSLKIGETSSPVRTAQGYSIIQLEDKIVKPLLTESEFAKKRDGLYQYVTLRKRKELARSFADSLRQALQISFEHGPLHELLRMLLQRTPGKPENTWLEGNKSLDKQEIARSRMTVWDVQNLKQRARYTSEEQLQWVKNEENLEDWIAGLMIRDVMLSQARQEGLDKSPEYISQVKKQTGDFLLKRMAESISYSTVVPQDSLLALYSENAGKWTVPPKIRLAEIALSDEMSANTIGRKLTNHIAFEKLASQYSIRAWSAENSGEIGSFTHHELGPYADRLFSIKPGQWTGPIKIDSLYIFFKCLAQYPAQQRSFAEAQAKVEKTLRPFYERRMKEETLRSCRSKTKIRVFYDRLRNLQI